MSSSTINNTGGVQSGDDVSGWLGLRDNQTTNTCAPGYSPPSCSNISALSGIFIQAGIVHDYPSYHGLFAQTSWRGRVDCGPNSSKTTYTGAFTSGNADAITYDCAVANPALDGFDLTNGAWVEMLAQYGDRVNVYVGNTWIMALFDYATQVKNNEILIETNLFGTPTAEVGSGKFDFVSSSTRYYSGGTWYEYPAPLGGASAWSFGMHTLNVNTGTQTDGNNPCMFYDPSTLPHWVGTQAGFGGVTSSLEAGRDVIDCWYNNGMIIHTGIQRSSPMAASVATSPLVPAPFPSHHSPNAPAPAGNIGAAAPMTLAASPTPAAPIQPSAPHPLPAAPPPAATPPVVAPTPGTLIH